MQTFGFLYGTVRNLGVQVPSGVLFNFKGKIWDWLSSVLLKNLHRDKKKTIFKKFTVCFKKEIKTHLNEMLIVIL